MAEDADGRHRLLMRKTSLACAALVVLVACGGGAGRPTPTNPSPIPGADACNSLGGTASTAGTSILNGVECSADRSSVVLLNMRTADDWTAGACTGTVVAPRAVLTAAHCLDEDVRTVRVWLGSGSEITAASFVSYPNYRFKTPGVFDVGVVFLAENLPRRPIPILTSRDGRVGETAILAGWGRAEDSAPPKLRAGSTTVSAVSAERLETLFAPPSSSVCSGDSGGPILLSEGGVWSVAGITSATSTSACSSGTNFYQAVRHPSVSGFILEHVPDIGHR